MKIPHAYNYISKW